MGEITRRWPFDNISRAGDRPWSQMLPPLPLKRQPFELIIREPALTGDSLGLKTWGSSYALAHMLPRLAETPLSHLFTSKRRQDNPPRAMELGSGTGLLGLAAAAIWRIDVILSDLPNIIPNLTFNVEKNRETVESEDGRVDVGALTWGGDEDEIDQERFGEHHQFDVSPRDSQSSLLHSTQKLTKSQIVLAADPLYDDNHPELLASTIDKYLRTDRDARVLVMVPMRDRCTKGLWEEFHRKMTQRSLFPGKSGIVTSGDDWFVDNEDDEEIICGWALFQRVVYQAASATVGGAGDAL